MKQDWNHYIGDLKVGRQNLGEEMPVVVYRLFEFTMKESIADKYGKDVAIELFRDAGKKAGKKFCEELLDVTQGFTDFISSLEEVMLSLKMGILRIEETDQENHHIVITVSEDLDCSGLPMTGEAVCNYDEGFLMGVLKEYTGQEYDVIEIDCWAKGGRVCRFKANIK
ncbi:V4R domain-containing protein [Anaerorhabdus sp.]|uniref:V4R domain-containing protein n=1 Tax=Anaerorhabdus sp. TaxID=1872524 RepID=UPI002FCB0839